MCLEMQTTRLEVLMKELRCLDPFYSTLIRLQLDTSSGSGSTNGDQ